MDQPNHYEAVLADLRAKRAELDTAIATIERVMGIATGATGTPQAAITASGAGVVRDGMFFGLSLTEAAQAYLQAVRRKQSAREIAEALERGGFHHTSKDFPNTVRAILSRNAANEGDFIKLQTDWGLSTWFPGRRKGARKDDGSQTPAGEPPADDEIQLEPEPETEVTS